MARFKFAMDFLVKMRRRKEEEAMMKLAKRLASIRDLEQQVAAMQEEKAALAADLSAKAAEGKLTAPLFVLYKEYQTRLAKEINRAEELLYLSKKEADRERAVLTRASIDRQIIEKFKEKKKNEFTAEQLYEEQNVLEEMAALAKARKTRNDALTGSGA